jgi:hypothetical protein
MHRLKTISRKWRTISSWEDFHAKQSQREADFFSICGQELGHQLIPSVSRATA